MTPTTLSTHNKQICILPLGKNTIKTSKKAKWINFKPRDDIFEVSRFISVSVDYYESFDIFSKLLSRPSSSPISLANMALVTPRFDAKLELSPILCSKCSSPTKYTRLTMMVWTTLQCGENNPLFNKITLNPCGKVNRTNIKK